MIMFKPLFSLLLSTGRPGGSVLSPTVSSSSFMMRSENFSSAGTLEVRVVFNSLHSRRAMTSSHRRVKSNSSDLGYCGAMQPQKVDILFM